MYATRYAQPQNIIATVCSHMSPFTRLPTFRKNLLQASFIQKRYFLWKLGKQVSPKGSKFFRKVDAYFTTHRRWPYLTAVRMTNILQAVCI